MDFTPAYFDSNYLEYTKVLPEHGSKAILNQSIGLYFNQELNLSYSSLQVVHPMKEVKGTSEQVFSFYCIEDKILTVFSQNEEATSSTLNVSFLKNYFDLG